MQVIIVDEIYCIKRLITYVHTWFDLITIRFFKIFIFEWRTKNYLADEKYI